MPWRPWTPLRISPLIRIASVVTMEYLHHWTRCLGQYSLWRAEFHQTYYNLLTCLSYPQIPQYFFSLKELCDALAHCIMYSLPYVFFFSVWRTCLSYRKLEPHHWLGRMLRLCNQDCWDPLLSFHTAGLPLPLLHPACPICTETKGL
jgi:hypothetical protein